MHGETMQICLFFKVGVNLHCHIEKRRQAAGFWEQGVEENIWTWAGGSGRRLGKAT